MDILAMIFLLMCAEITLAVAVALAVVYGWVYLFKWINRNWPV